MNQRKIERLKKLEEKASAEAAARELYTEKDEFVECRRCLKCKAYRAFPVEFKNSRGNLPSDDVCYSCISSKSEQEAAYRKAKSVNCKCGSSYVCPNDKAKIRHELSDKHKRNLELLLSFNSSKYTVKQLR